MTQRSLVVVELRWPASVVHACLYITAHPNAEILGGLGGNFISPQVVVARHGWASTGSLTS